MPHFRPHPPLRGHRGGNPPPAASRGVPPGTRPPGARVAQRCKPTFAPMFVNILFYKFIKFYILTGFLLFDVFITIIICTKNL